MFSCEFCDKSFNQHRNLRRHIRQWHTSVTLLPSLKQEPTRWFQCPFCLKKYRTERIVQLHVAKEHETQPKISKPKRYSGNVKNNCPLQCSFNSIRPNKVDIINHLKQCHNIEVQQQNLTFVNYDEFLNWKIKIELESNTKFIVGRSNLLSGTKTKYYFSCHRSGHYLTKSKGLRKLKTQGSKKINGLCPSRIILQKNNLTGECSVTYYKTHVGHETPALEDNISLRKTKPTLRNGKLNFKIRTIHAKHKKSLKMATTIVVEEDECWLVPSDTDSIEMFTVKKSGKVCNDCNLSCNECMSCIHEYNCTCIDNSTKCNMCTHIHLVCRLLLSKCKVGLQPNFIPYSQNLVLDKSVSTKETQTSRQTVNSSFSSPSENTMKIDLSLQSRKIKILRAVKDLLICATSLEEIDTIDNAVDEIIGKLNPTLPAISSKVVILKPSSASTPENRYIQPQMRFLPTRPSYSRTKPSECLIEVDPEESKNVGLELILEYNEC